MSTGEELTPRRVKLRRSADRPRVLRNVRKLLLRSPTVVRIAKDVYRWPPLSHSKPFKWIVGRRVATADAALAQTVPRISIETVLTCNARCTMCVHSEKRMVGLMSMDLFRDLIAQCASWGVQDVCLSIYGEPLVDKHWLERVRLVRDAGLRYSFFSNASMLTEDKAKAMLDMGGWTDVNFSVNGFSKDIYEATMPPLSRERVYGNIERFLELKSKYREGPTTAVSCVTLAENEHEMEDYRRYWSTRVDRVSIADRSDWLGELKKTDVAQGVGKRLRVVQEETWIQPCPSVWSSMFVYYDGQVSPCCEDAGLRKLIIGDASKDSLRDIFLGPGLGRLRAEHRADRRCEHEICGKCRVNWPWI